MGLLTPCWLIPKIFLLLRVFSFRRIIFHTSCAEPHKSARSSSLPISFRSSKRSRNTRKMLRIPFCSEKTHKTRTCVELSLEGQFDSFYCTAISNKSRKTVRKISMTTRDTSRPLERSWFSTCCAGILCRAESAPDVTRNPVSHTCSTGLKDFSGV